MAALLLAARFNYAAARATRRIQRAGSPRCRHELQCRYSYTLRSGRVPVLPAVVCSHHSLCAATVLPPFDGQDAAVW